MLYLLQIDKGRVLQWTEVWEENRRKFIQYTSSASGVQLGLVLKSCSVSKNLPGVHGTASIHKQHYPTHAIWSESHFKKADIQKSQNL